MFGLFSNNNQAAQQQQAQSQQPPASLPGQAPAAPGNQAQPGFASGQQPGQQQQPAGTMPGTNQVPPNPLDVYSKLFDNANKATDAPPVFSVDPTVVNDVASTLDFTKSVDPALMQKANTGDVAALMQVINTVGREAYKASLSHNTALTDKFVGARSAYDMGKIGSQVKSELVSSHITDVPNSSHPVVRNELKRIASAMQAQNPEATPAEIAEQARAYFVNLTNALQPAPQNTATQQDTDWDKYFSR